jgi:hypothetical protein
MVLLMPMLNVEMSNREAALVIAALRNWQDEAKTTDLEDLFEAYFENEGGYEDTEIDALCSRISKAALQR